MARGMAKAFVVLVAVVMCRAASAGPIEDSAAMGERWMSAFHEGNPDGIADLYAEDATYWSFGSPQRVAGKEAIRALFVRFFKAYPTRKLVKRDIVARAYGPTVVRNYYWTLDLADAKGNARTVSARSSIVYTDVGGRRAIVEHHTSVLPEPPAASPATAARDERRAP